MDLKRNKKEIVKNRLKQTAAKIWGYKESEMEEFDPAVDLLFGACASEFERLSSEVYVSQTRILEKVAHILLPEVYLCPVPSYAIAHGKPLNPKILTKQEDQFVIEKEFSSKSSGNVEKKKIFFSPIPGFRLIDAEITLMATSHEIIQLNNLVLKETIVKSKTIDFPHKNKLWLGLKIHPDVGSLIDISFYFDWLNNPDRLDLLKLLKISKWFVNNKLISVKNGFNNKIEANFASETSDITSFLDINIKTEKRINHYCENNFITITEKIIPEKRKYPIEFNDFFEREKLDIIKEELHWIEIEFPETFPAEYLASTFCTPTAFPVMNRRLHNSNRPYTLNNDLNIIPPNFR